MKVNDLINILSDLPSDLEVFTEGKPIHSVIHWKGNDTYTSNGEWDYKVSQDKPYVEFEA